MKKYTKVKKRILIALLVSILLHIGFLVWSYFAKILPATPFPDKVETVFHVKIDRQENMGTQEKLKFDMRSFSKSPRPDNSFTENRTSDPLIESEALIENNIESVIQIFKKSDLNDAVMAQKVRRSVREDLAGLGEVPREAFPSNEFQVMQRTSAGIENESKSMDLGTALTYQLFKYQDPASGQKYFKLVVKVRDATMNFPVIPKEIIFLVDASGSIGTERLAQFEEGLAYSLKHLNSDDRFNIFVFKNKIVPFSPGSLRASPKNIKDAVEFLKELRSWSTTDLYGALRASINLKTPFVPSYRVLMSDGFPTTGILDARRVINEISRLNDNKVSIFTFGGGVDVEPYMLDFIAFKNRGWSRVSGREYFMGRDFSRFYDEIKDPLLLNVRYYAVGLKTQEIFPQTMPDFFKRSQFVIYGRYTNENKFVIQIRGDMAQHKKGFIVSANLQDAWAGDKQIAHNWAFHKIYYLIGELKYNENNKALIDSINDLCAKFHIITPYSIKQPKGSKP